jgi:hypothetical protein
MSQRDSDSNRGADGVVIPQSESPQIAPESAPTASTEEALPAKIKINKLDMLSYSKALADGLQEFGLKVKSISEGNSGSGATGKVVFEFIKMHDDTLGMGLFMLGTRGYPIDSWTNALAKAIPNEDLTPQQLTLLNNIKEANSKLAFTVAKGLFTIIEEMKDWYRELEATTKDA